MILVSDGNSGLTDTDDKTIPAAKELHDTGALTYAFTFSSDYYFPELKLYAGQKDNVYVNGRSEQFKTDVVSLVRGGANCPQVTLAPTPAPTKGCNVDLLIILDTSGSVAEEYPKERQFAVDVANRFAEGDYVNRLRVAVVTFYNSAKLIAKFGDQRSKSEVITMLKGIEHTGGGTSSPSALRMATQEIQARGRSDARLYVVHISDGNSADPIESVMSAATALKATGAHVFTTTFSSDAYLPELNIIADAEHRIYVLDRAPLLADAVAREANDGANCGPTPVVAPRPVVATCGKLDIMIILDTSGSVETVYEKEKQLALDIIKQIPSNQFDTRVVVAAVSFAATSVVEMEFNSQRTKEKVLQTIENIKQMYGATSIASGARDAVRQIQGRRRSDAKTAVVLISDGHSQDRWEEVVAASQSLKDTGAVIYAVTLSNDYSLPELQQYAGDTQRVFTDARTSNFLGEMQRVTAEASCKAQKRRRRRAANSLNSIANESGSDCDFVDLVFVIDTSGSVQSDFLQERKVAEDIVQRIPAEAFASGRLSVSVVKFFSIARLEIPFDHPQDKASVLSQIRGIKHTGGATSGVAGMRAALRSLEHGHRREARSFVVLISDGNSQDPFDITRSTAINMLNTGATVYTSSLSASYYLPELEIYAGTKENVFVGNRIPQLVEKVSSMVSSKSCGFVAPPVVPTPSKVPCVGGMDLMIILDTSGSIQRIFEDQKKFAMDVVSSLEDSEVGRRTSVGLIAFSDRVETVLRFGNTLNKQQVIMNDISNDSQSSYSERYLQITFYLHNFSFSTGVGWSGQGPIHRWQHSNGQCSPDSHPGAARQRQSWIQTSRSAHQRWTFAGHVVQCTDHFGEITGMGKLRNMT